MALTAWGAEAGALPEIQTVETRAATPLRGTFRLAFRGQWTWMIPRNMTVTVLKDDAGEPALHRTQVLHSVRSSPERHSLRCNDVRLSSC